MKIASTVFVSGLIAVTLVYSGRLNASDRMTPGQWELTTTTKGDTRVVKFCADANTLSIANGDARTGQDALSRIHTKTRCKVDAFKVEGSTVSYTLNCPDTTVRFTETYHGDRYEGVGVVLNAKTASEEIGSTYKARRLGACP